MNAYDAGVSALNEARKIEEEQKARLFQIQNQIERNQSLQKDLAEERLLLAKERVGSGKGKIGQRRQPQKMALPASVRGGGVVSAVASTASANISAGEIIDRVDVDETIEEERTIADVVDSLLVDPTPSGSRDQLQPQQQQHSSNQTFAKSHLSHLHSRLNLADFPRTSAALNQPQNRSFPAPNASASHDRFSNILGAALGGRSSGNPADVSLPPYGADEVLLSSFGQLGDASTTDAVLLLIDGQREDEYLKEEQKFLTRLKLTNKKR